MSYHLCSVGRVFTKGPGDCGSIPGRVKPKPQKTVLDTSLLNTQPYKVCIKGKEEQFRENSSTLLYTSSYQKGSLWVTLDYSHQFYIYVYIYIYI